MGGGDQSHGWLGGLWQDQGGLNCFQLQDLSVSSNHNVVLKVRETVVDGFDKMPQALMGLFTGDNTGKMVVKA